MIFNETGLSGSWFIEPERKCDERGFFVRTFCEREFSERSLESRFVQTSLSYNKLKGTLRGLHFQLVPHEEVKIVGCIKGAVYDVLVDLRRVSPTFGRWRAYELSEENGYQIYIPKGFGHGYQTLSDDAVVSYAISEFYVPDAASGIRFDDPALGVEWPLPPTVISDRDYSWSNLETA
jgi:dTDP-4-dehydrorhamnose 3,5-epimerase